jgi:hypothetical protein
MIEGAPRISNPPWIVNEEIPLHPVRHFCRERRWRYARAGIYLPTLLPGSIIWNCHVIRFHAVFGLNSAINERGDRRDPIYFL